MTEYVILVGILALGMIGTVKLYQAVMARSFASIADRLDAVGESTITGDTAIASTPTTLGDIQANHSPHNFNRTGNNNICVVCGKVVRIAPTE